MSDTTAGTAASKPPQPAERSFVAPRQFTGQGRLFIQRIAGAGPAIDAMVADLTKRLAARLATSPVLRREKLVDAERIWNAATNSLGRIAIEHNLTDLRAPVFQEMRLVVAKLHFPEWTEDARELCVNLVRISVTVRNRRPAFRHETLALVGLHALARRYQRGTDTSDAAIIADIAALASVSLDPATPQFVCATSGGRWVGELVNMGAGGPVVAASRSYYDSDHQSGDQRTKPWQQRVADRAARTAAARSA